MSSIQLTNEKLLGKLQPDGMDPNAGSKAGSV